GELLSQSKLDVDHSRSIVIVLARAVLGYGLDVLRYGLSQGVVFDQLPLGVESTFDLADDDLCRFLPLRRDDRNRRGGGEGGQNTKDGKDHKQFNKTEPTTGAAWGFFVGDDHDGLPSQVIQSIPAVHETFTAFPRSDRKS